MANRKDKTTRFPVKLDWFEIRKKLAELRLKQGTALEPPPKAKKHRIKV